MLRRPFLCSGTSNLCLSRSLAPGSNIHHQRSTYFKFKLFLSFGAAHSLVTFIIPIRTGAYGNRETGGDPREPSRSTPASIGKQKQTHEKNPKTTALETEDALERFYSQKQRR